MSAKPIDASSPTIVVVLLYPRCTIAETIGLATHLVDAGVDVVHVGVETAMPAGNGNGNGGADRAEIVDRSGLVLRPDRAISDLDPASIAAVVIPGGDPERIIGDQAVSSLLVEVAATGRVVAGICAGVLVMADAGLTSDRAITHNYRPPWASPEITSFTESFWADAHVEPDRSVGVVVDGNLITALPDATVEFAAAVTHLLGSVLHANSALPAAGRSAGETVRNFFERMQARDWGGAGELLAPDIRIDFSETGERFSGPNFLAMNRAYPEGWSIEVVETVTQGERVSAQVRVDHGGTVFWCAGFYHVAGGVIASGVEHWVTEGAEAAPDWRKHLADPVER